MCYILFHEKLSECMLASKNTHTTRIANLLNGSGVATAKEKWACDLHHMAQINIFTFKIKWCEITKNN